MQILIFLFNTVQRSSLLEFIDNNNKIINESTQMHHFKSLHTLGY